MKTYPEPPYKSVLSLIDRGLTKLPLWVKLIVAISLISIAVANAQEGVMFQNIKDRPRVDLRIKSLHNYVGFLSTAAVTAGTLYVRATSNEDHIRAFMVPIGFASATAMLITGYCGYRNQYFYIHKGKKHRWYVYTPGSLIIKFE